MTRRAKKGTLNAKTHFKTDSANFKGIVNIEGLLTKNLDISEQMRCHTLTDGYCMIENGNIVNIDKNGELATKGHVDHCMYKEPEKYIKSGDTKFPCYLQNIQDKKIVEEVLVSKDLFTDSGLYFNEFRVMKKKNIEIDKDIVMTGGIIRDPDGDTEDTLSYVSEFRHLFVYVNQSKYVCKFSKKTIKPFETAVFYLDNGAVNSL